MADALWNTDPNTTAQIAAADMPQQQAPLPSLVNAAPVTGLIPKSFTEYAADPVNVAKIPEPVPANTPLPTVAAKALSQSDDDISLFQRGIFDSTPPTAPSLPAPQIAGPPQSPTPEDSIFSPTQPQPKGPPRVSQKPLSLEDSLMAPSGPPNGGLGLAGGTDFHIPTRQEILAAHPAIIPAPPKVPHGWGLAAAGLFAALDNAGAVLDHGTPTVGPGLVRNAQALQEYNQNLPLLRQQAEDQSIDEYLKQEDTAAQVNDRIAQGWQRLHPKVPAPKVLFNQGGVPYAVQHGQDEYTIGDPNMPAYLQPLVQGANAAYKQRLQDQENQKAGPSYQQGTIDSLNKALTDRWQVLNPGKPLPPEFTLQSGARKSDYDTIDKGLEAVERATGTKAQQDTANEIRRQTLQISQQNARDREQKQSAIPIIGFDNNGHQIFTNMGSSDAAGLTQVRQVGQQEAEKVTNARGLIPVFDSKDPEDPGILQVVDKLDKEGKLGPMASRWNEFLDGKYGSGDPDFEKFRTLMGLAQTGLMQVHVGARGSSQLLEHFQDLVNEKKMDAGTLKAGLQTELGYIKGKAMLPSIPTNGSGAQQSSNANGLPPVQPGYTRFKDSQGGIHDIPSENLQKAKQRDPNLQVMQ